MIFISKGKNRYVQYLDHNIEYPKSNNAWELLTLCPTDDLSQKVTLVECASSIMTTGGAGREGKGIVMDIAEKPERF